MAQKKVERVRVDGPSGPIEVHPLLVEKFPDRYKPFSDTKSESTTKPAKGAEKEG